MSCPCRASGVWFFFFFSSRRRHTRLQGDWSSDVCSSDLEQFFERRQLVQHGPPDGLRQLADKTFEPLHDLDRKSTRLNSSHLVISYAVFCLKKKKKTT